MTTERKAKRQAAYEAWKARVNEVLMLHIGLIDEELCEQTARFLVREAWLTDGKPELENRHVLLIAKAVGQENRRDFAYTLRERIKQERAIHNDRAADLEGGAAAEASGRVDGYDEVLALLDLMGTDPR